MAPSASPLDPLLNSLLQCPLLRERTLQKAGGLNVPTQHIRQIQRVWNRPHRSVSRSRECLVMIISCSVLLHLRQP